MSAYVDRCDRCKQPFNAKPRKKLCMMREVGGGFSTDGWSRYYCEKCAFEVEKAVRRFEMEE